MEASQPSPVTVDVAHAQSPPIDHVVGYVGPVIAQGTTAPVPQAEGQRLRAGRKSGWPRREGTRTRSLRRCTICPVVVGEEGQGFGREAQEVSYEKACDFLLSLLSVSELEQVTVMDLEAAMPSIAVVRSEDHDGG